MSGAVIENLSGRKLLGIVCGLLICQIICFLIGGLCAPVPSSVQTILPTICQDNGNSFNDSTKWFWTRGEGSCTAQTSLENTINVRSNPRAILAFQMPLPRDGYILDFSRWQQSLIGMLQLEIKLTEDATVLPQAIPITLDARLAFANKHQPQWQKLAIALEQRHLECQTEAYHILKCDPVALFELGSLHHDYYLLNIRFPVDTDRQFNLQIEEITDATVTAIYQNGGFTKVWLGLKFVFAVAVCIMLGWFWHRLHQLQRKAVLLEWMLMGLGAAMTLLNLPIELATLSMDMPFMLLLTDIRQGIFYAVLLSFWLIFTGEHLMIQLDSQRTTLSSYWRHLSAVGVSCVALFAFDMCERGIKLRNPFYSVWISPLTANIASIFIGIATISALIYFVFLCFMVYRVMKNIGAKKTSMSTMSAARRHRYNGVIYRFQFLMLATIVCAAFTVVGFVMGQVDEQQLKWNETTSIEMNSAFLTGVYGMWNIYVVALLALYAPSHKKHQQIQPPPPNISTEEIEFSNFPAESNPSEISSLTSFSRKAAFE